jgi:hypothetical protein
MPRDLTRNLQTSSCGGFHYLHSSCLKQALFVHKCMVLVFAVIYRDYAERTNRNVNILCRSEKVLVCEKGLCNLCEQ